MFWAEQVVLGHEHAIRQAECGAAQERLRAVGHGRRGAVAIQDRRRLIDARGHRAAGPRPRDIPSRSQLDEVEVADPAAAVGIGEYRRPHVAHHEGRLRGCFRPSEDAHPGRRVMLDPHHQRPGVAAGGGRPHAKAHPRRRLIVHSERDALAVDQPRLVNAIHARKTSGIDRYVDVVARLSDVRIIWHYIVSGARRIERITAKRRCEISRAFDEDAKHPIGLSCVDIEIRVEAGPGDRVDRHVVVAAGDRRIGRAGGKRKRRVGRAMIDGPLHVEAVAGIEDLAEVVDRRRFRDRGVRGRFRRRVATVAADEKVVRGAAGGFSPDMSTGGVSGSATGAIALS